MNHLIRTTAICIVLMALTLFSGCALFESTIRHEDGLKATTVNFELTPEMLKAVPALKEDTSVEPVILSDGSVLRDGDGNPVMRKITSIVRGIPPALKSQAFAASSDVADSNTDLLQNSNQVGSSVTASRVQTGNEATATVAGQTQASRTEATADLALSLAKEALQFAGIKVTQENETERAKIGAEKEVELKKIEHAPVEAHVVNPHQTNNQVGP